MIKMCYAKMSEPASGDRLTLEAPVSEGEEKYSLVRLMEVLRRFQKALQVSLLNMVYKVQKGADISILLEITRLSVFFTVLNLIPVKRELPIYTLLYFAHCVRGKY